MQKNQLQRSPAQRAFRLLWTAMLAILLGAVAIVLLGAFANIGAVELLLVFVPVALGSFFLLLRRTQLP